MNSKRTVNYSDVMKAPTTFKIAFWKINLPWTFRLETTMLYVVSFLLVQLVFHYPLKWLGDLIKNLDKVGAIGLPYLLTVYLMGRPTDGKPIFYFVKDTLLYYFMEKRSRKKYCHEEVVEWMDESVQFTGLKIEKRREVKSDDEFNLATKDDPQKSVINE